MEFGTARFGDIYDEAQPLLIAHWHEIAFYPDVPLEPRRDVYERMDEAGALRIFIARDHGRLVGYVAYIVTPHMHYASMKVAAQDVLFLLPEYRGPGKAGPAVGGGLIIFSERLLKEEGVQNVTQHVKRALDFSPLLRALGYEEMETTYSKRL